MTTEQQFNTMMKTKTFVNFSFNPFDPELERNNYDNWIFINCELNYFNFSHRLVKCSLFIKCQMRNCDFSETLLQNVLFKDCDLRNANFKKSIFFMSLFNNCNIRGSDMNIESALGLEFRHCKTGGK